VVEDLDIPQNRLAESAERVIDRSVEEAHRREHGLLTNEHICLAFAQVEWDFFGEIMRDNNLNPHEFITSLEEHLKLLPASGRELRVAPATKLLFKLALLHASRCGRHAIEAIDLFSAIFEETQGVPVSILRRQGIEPELLVTRLATRVRDQELREERLKKRFELPPFLKHFATNLNQLAWQDKLPPVFGRELEMQQALEILCHRERSNSVLLIGEPGVGKTAIVEGLARRIEFEPESIPVRLRDCQIVNLQMNTMVAGTMLRGMFEDRIQNVIREIKERPNLILFIDEVHTMIGAGSALGAPSDAANVFKSVLARGEVRIIGATTLGEYKEFIQEDEALARRFRTVQVDEPTLDQTRTILYNLRPRLERNYSVRIQDDAIDIALEMSPRYMRHLQLPDKVIGWLDTAAVRAEIDRRYEVRADDVVDVISNAARIPRDMVFRDVNERFRDVETRLGHRVVGQRPAISSVARRLVLNKGPLKDGFDRPDGVLLFLGPTGVGKTELAKSVAHYLFGDEKKLIRVDMSEYQDGAVGVDKMIGMPRGIVGSERGGILTNQLKDNPYSVVLLDEIEKASPNMLTLFLDCHHDVQRGHGALPQAHQSARVLLGPDRARPGERRDQPGARAAFPAGVPEPHRRSRALHAPDPRRRQGDRRAGAAEARSHPAQGGQAPRRGTRRARPAGEGWLQPGLRSALPETRDRGAHQGADQPGLAGRPRVPRAVRGRADRRRFRDAARERHCGGVAATSRTRPAPDRTPARATPPCRNRPRPSGCGARDGAVAAACQRCRGFSSGTRRARTSVDTAVDSRPAVQGTRARGTP
jgi:ATP-dependent Clp protease ATP-binding subunit ClpA